jgi:hypothetical protein
MPLQLFHQQVLRHFRALGLIFNRQAWRVVTNKLKRNRNPLRLLRHVGGMATRLLEKLWSAISPDMPPRNGAA